MEITDEKIQKAFNNEENKYLLGLNSETMKKMVKEILVELDLSKMETLKMQRSLQNYKYVDEVSDLKYGTYIRWISLKNEGLKLNYGALFCETKISDNGISILCKSVFGNRLFQLMLDENIVFQKLTNEEIILLTAMDFLSK
jgi:hypothetical protein